MRSIARAAVLAALVLVGCTGASSEPAAPKSGPAPSAAAAVAVAAVPLRRLTREEYNNTVRDLLADTTRPANAFPPDETVGGFESNGMAPVTALQVERYMDAAEALSTAAVGRLEALAPCAAGQPQEQCAQSFIDSFGRLAYRRPLDEAERAQLSAVYAEKAKRSGHAGGVQLVLEVILQSPQFLYRLEPADGPADKTRPLTGYELATRLSYFIWASTPDSALLEDAEAGRLSEADDVAVIARRMLKDPRAVDGIKSFHRQWLGLRELETESKDVVHSAAFTPELKAAMLEETLRFSAHAVLAGGDTVKTLLTSNKTFVNAPLASLYGVPSPAQGFALVELPAQQRSGVLTQASVMTVLSTADQTSPILRGKFVRERLLCHSIPPPPPNVSITPPKADPKLTTKERFDLHRKDPACAGCHALMDPIGFGFENYNALGAWRTVEGTLRVDATGELTLTDDIDGPFNGAVELGARLSASQEVRRCIATQWLRFALGRGEEEEDEASLSEAYQTFAQKGFDVRELIVAIATSHAFRHARFKEGSAS
ncbi:MAG: DUF1592 domain-containing protein [Polyangiaceae bacterium]|nr:DUF1592 domain-containing protein [Polyangiaceae bacterium]